MRRSTARGGRAFAYIALLTFAQLLMPGLAQIAPPPAIGGPTQLLPGTMPFTTEQMSCFIAAAAESDALETYFDVSALLGLASLYGNSSAYLEQLLADPEVAELMELPLSTVNANYEAWVNQTMEACGMPDLLDSTGAKLTSDQVMAWFNSMKTSDLLAGMDFDMTPTDADEDLANTDFTALLVAAGMPTSARRRLRFWGAKKAWRAKAAGGAYGVGSSYLAVSAGTAAKGIVVGTLLALSAPVSLTAVAGMATFAAVSSLTKKEVDKLATPLITGYTNDTKMRDAFTSGMAYGSAAHALLIDNGISSTSDFTSAKITRLLVNSGVKGKAKEWAIKGTLAVGEAAWAKANAGDPEVAKLLPDLLAKAGAVRRLAAAAADGSRANWKAVATKVVIAAVEEAGLNPADMVTDGLAAALEPTPGVESTGELTVEDTTEFEPLDAEDVAGDADDGNGAEISSPNDGSADEGGSTGDDAATDEGGEGGSSGDDGNANEGGSTGDDGNADESGSTGDDGNADEDTNDDAAIEESSSTDDAAGAEEVSSTDDVDSTEQSSSTDDVDNTEESTSTTDDGVGDETTSTTDDGAESFSTDSTSEAP